MDPVSTWHLLQENGYNAIHYASRLIKTHRKSEDKEQYWFPTPENPGDEASQTPLQKGILSELCTLQDLEQLNPLDNQQSR